MAEITELIQFEAGKKAIASQVNENFETLRQGHNNHEARINTLNSSNAEKYDKSGGALSGALYLNNPANIVCDSETLTLNNQTNFFKVSGISTIQRVSGWTQGFAIIQFESARLLKNSNILKLQSNTDRLTQSGDTGFYLFENDVVTEINYFSAKEDKTNSFKTQTILNCPKNEKGKPDFIKKIEFSLDIVPAMASAENEDCIITSSSAYDANYLPWKVFRNHNADVYSWLTQSGVPTGWLKITFKKTTPKVAAISINSRNATDAGTISPKNFIVEGSNDDLNWDLLGDFNEITGWAQNEKRTFALRYTDNYKYYRLTIVQNNGHATLCGIGELELFESLNDIMPLSARITLSQEKSLLLNNGKGYSLKGKVNELALICETYNLTNILDNALMYVGFEKQSDNSFAPIVTTAQPVYSYNLQKHSNYNSVPDMISYTTSLEFKAGYSCSSSSVYNASYYAFNAFDKNMASKWMASVPGGNQYLQFDFPNYRKVARFGITTSVDAPAGSIKNAYIKGWNGEEWVVLCEIKNQPAWYANETRYFDADNICYCSKFKVEILELITATQHAQIALFEIFELAYCFVIPENKFYLYNPETKEYVAKEVNFIGKLKSEHNFVQEVRCYAQESKYISDEIDLAINATFNFYHNLGLDYKNMKVTGWIKDKVNNFVLPWDVDSNIDYSHERNNYGFHVDDCIFAVRTSALLMQYKDYYGTNRSITSNVSLILQIERSFE